MPFYIKNAKTKIMNIENLLRLLFPKTIQKIENDIANKTYYDMCGYPEDKSEYQYDKDYPMDNGEDAYPDYDYINETKFNDEYDEEYEARQVEILEMEEALYFEERYNIEESHKEPEAFVPPCSIGDSIHIVYKNGVYTVVDLNDKTFTITCGTWQRNRPKIYQTEELEWSEFKCLHGMYRKN